jgi:hypothetical protein
MKEKRNWGTNWDLVTCRYRVRLENHAPYHDWVCLPSFFYCNSLLPQSTSFVAFNFYFDFSAITVYCNDQAFPLTRLTS